VVLPKIGVSAEHADHVSSVRLGWTLVLALIFGSVYFEKVPFTSFAGANSSAFSETARIMRSGGSLVIDTGPAAPQAQIVGSLSSAGFTNITISIPGFLRITATLGGK